MTDPRGGRWRRRSLRLVAAALVAAAVFSDARRPPTRQAGVRMAVAALSLHRATWGRWLHAQGVRCRFVPSCSVFAERVLEDRGLWPALPVIGRRLVRCGPWTPPGPNDPWPPEAAVATPPVTALPSAGSPQAAGDG